MAGPPSVGRRPRRPEPAPPPRRRSPRRGRAQTPAAREEPGSGLQRLRTDTKATLDAQAPGRASPQAPEPSLASPPPSRPPQPRGPLTSRGPRSAQPQSGAARTSPGAFRLGRPFLGSSPRGRQPFRSPALLPCPRAAAPCPSPRSPAGPPAPEVRPRTAHSPRAPSAARAPLGSRPGRAQGGRAHRPGRGRGRLPAAEFSWEWSRGRAGDGAGRSTRSPPAPGPRAGLEGGGRERRFLRPPRVRGCGRQAPAAPEPLRAPSARPLLAAAPRPGLPSPRRAPPRRLPAAPPPPSRPAAVLTPEWPAARSRHSPREAGPGRMLWLGLRGCGALGAFRRSSGPKEEGRSERGKGPFSYCLLLPCKGRQKGNSAASRG